ncbi:toxin VapC [Archaeoglobales archaeon]|nr:MAG: toxin VapC [Archaeoglobales archaeon]
MIFDASSIFVAIKNLKLDVLRGTTCELAKFELGNAVWKEINIHKSVNIDEGLKILDVLMKALETMNVKNPNWNEVLKLAVKHDLTFYDASYVQLAVESSDVLVTEDKKLSEKIKGFVDVICI